MSFLLGNLIFHRLGNNIFLRELWAKHFPPEVTSSGTLFPLLSAQLVWVCAAWQLFCPNRPKSSESKVLHLNPWYHAGGPRQVWHVVNENGQKSTQMTWIYSYTWQGVSVPYCLPNSAPTVVKGSVLQNRNHFISSLLSSPSCPSPREPVHKALKIGCYSTIYSAVWALREKSHQTLFL